MADADFSGVLNPKRVTDKRMQQAEGGASAPPKKGDMSQADFSWGRKRTPQEENIRQKKLVEKLRSRDAGY